MSYLCFAGTSTPSEQLCSAAGNVASKKRASLSQELGDMLTFVHCNAQFLTKTDAKTLSTPMCTDRTQMVSEEVGVFSEESEPHPIMQLKELVSSIVNATAMHSLQRGGVLRCHAALIPDSHALPAEVES
ncbi:unnamed protein product [Arctogadus glacialis]